MNIENLLKGAEQITGKSGGYREVWRTAHGILKVDTETPEESACVWTDTQTFWEVEFYSVLKENEKIHFPRLISHGKTEEGCTWALYEAIEIPEEVLFSREQEQEMRELSREFGLADLQFWGGMVEDGENWTVVDGKVIFYDFAANCLSLAA